MCSQMQLCPGVHPVCISFVTKTWNCRMMEILITQFRFFVLTNKCYFMLLFIVHLPFKFGTFFSLQSFFHSVQNLVPIELTAFFSQRIKLCRYFRFHCTGYWKTANMFVSSYVMKIIKLSLKSVQFSCFMLCC